MDLVWFFAELLNWDGALVLFLVFVPLERLLPLHREQETLRKDWSNDLVWLLVNGLPIRLGMTVVIAAILVLSRHAVPADLKAWVGDMSLWLQVPLVILIADLGFYAAHRTFHAVPFLWRFHAVHHSIEHMDWLASHRLHPIDQILTMTVSLGPIYALGFDAAAIAIHAVIFHWHSILLHANLRLSFGPLGAIFVSPHFHHWHHANERHAYDKNFAAQLSFIDRLFRTHHELDRLPESYGCADPVPAEYHRQLLYPVMPTRMARKDVADGHAARDPAADPAPSVN